MNRRILAILMMIVLVASLLPSNLTVTAAETSSTTNATEIYLGMEVYAPVTSLGPDGEIVHTYKKVTLPDTAVDGRNYYVDKGQYVVLTPATDSAADKARMNIEGDAVLGEAGQIVLEDGETVEAIPVIRAGKANLTVESESGSITRKYTVTAYIPADDISLYIDGEPAGDNFSVIQGYTGTISAALSPEDTTDQIIWKSSDRGVVEVSADGSLKTTGYGEAIVSCTLADARTGARDVSAEVTIYVAEKILYNQMAFSESLSSKEAISAAAVAAGKDKQLYLFDPSNTDAERIANEAVTWESSDVSVIEVNSEGRITAQPNMNGTARVTAKSESGIEAELEVTVYIEVAEVAFDTLQYQVPQGQTIQIPYIVTPGNAGEEMEWTSNDPEAIKVLGVEKDELVNGKSILTLEILKVTDGYINVIGKAAKSGRVAQLQVQGLHAIHAEKIIMNPSAFVRTKTDVNGNVIYCIERGTDFKITAEVTPSDYNDILDWEFTTGSGADASKLMTLSYEKNIADISAKATGSVVVRCKSSGGITGECYLQIISSSTDVAITDSKDIVIDKLQVNVNEPSVVKAEPSAGSTDTVTWTVVSGDSANVVLDSRDLALSLTCKQPGDYIIRVTTESGKHADINIRAVNPVKGAEFVKKENQQEIRIDSLVLCKGHTATVYMKNFRPADTTDTLFQWKDDKGLLQIKVAEDTKSAVITGLTSGTTTIKIVGQSGYEVSLPVRVLVPAATVLIEGKQNPEDVIVYKGGSTVKVTALLTPTNTDDMLTWTVDKEGIVTIAASSQASGPTQTVTLTGAEHGEITLTATAGSGASASVRVIVKALDVGGCQATVQAQTYTGEALTPLPTRVTLDGRILMYGTDYEITGYANNINAGTATMMIKGVGNYSGTTELTFTINEKKIDSSVSVVYEEEYAYNGADIFPDVVVKIGETVLTQDKDYTLTLPEEASRIGTYKFTVNFLGNITGSLNKNYKVVPRSAETFIIKDKNGKIVERLQDKNYVAEKITQTFTVYDGETLLEENVDYTIEYMDNQNAGTATIVITGRGNYDPSTTKRIHFTIKPYSLSKVQVTKINDLEYNGMEQEPSILARRQINNTWKHLVKGIDYEIAYENNLNTGRATVKLTPGSNGNYTSSKTINFRIRPAQVKGLVQKSASVKSVKLTWDKCEGEVTGYSVYKFKDDKYTYIKSTKENEIVISGLNSGSNYIYVVRAYKMVGKMKYHGTAYSSFITAMTASNTPSIKLASSNLTVKVSWKQSKGATKYYVYYSTNNGKSYKRAGYSSSASYTINGGLKKGKKIYVKLKAARIIAGKEYQGPSSKVKSITVKK